MDQLEITSLRFQAHPHVLVLAILTVLQGIANEISITALNFRHELPCV